MDAVKDDAETDIKSEEKISAPDDKGEDDLTKIEGIGPKIAEILNSAEINSFKALAEKDVEKLKEILAEAGNRYKSHDPSSWPEQAALAAEGKWDELKQRQDELNGGRE
ncbi:MAG: helix-hairpin-helix domain-containing protein [Melioribacteraceae bacterium]|nr:helix-hairpin-helix domain-containing protein [Melioribacteraceae bacterium]